MYLGSVKVNQKRSAVKKYEVVFGGKMRLCACEACALRRVCDMKGGEQGTKCCSLGINERGCKAMRRREALRLANHISLLPFRNECAADDIGTAERNIIGESVGVWSSELMWEVILPALLDERTEDLSVRELGELVCNLNRSDSDWRMRKSVDFCGEWKVESFRFDFSDGESLIYTIKTARIGLTDVTAWGILGERMSYFAV